MQTDMHYYGVYTLARCAGVEAGTARAIASAAEYVDDSDKVQTKLADGSHLISKPTAHHPFDAANLAPIDQRETWVPFHFIPGNEGQSRDMRLVCTTDSNLARTMVARNLSLAREEFGIPLVGITAHVYADTFAHYGFSGISSSVNHVRPMSFEFDTSEQEKTRLQAHRESFFEEYVEAPGADWASSLGHAGGATFPDRPYLRWRFAYADGRDSGWRDNPATFLRACKKLYEMFIEFGRVTDGDFSDNSTKVAFESIESTLRAILATQGEAGVRAEAWNTAVTTGKLFSNPRQEPIPRYDVNRYLADFEKLPSMPVPKVKETEVYLFLQAANNHRSYVLKELLKANDLVLESTLSDWVKRKVSRLGALLSDRRELQP